MEQPSFHIFSNNLYFDFTLALKFSFSLSSTQRSKRSHVEMKCPEELRSLRQLSLPIFLEGGLLNNHEIVKENDCVDQ